MQHDLIKTSVFFVCKKG